MISPYRITYCFDCGGDGTHHDKTKSLTVRCYACKGTGVVTYMQRKKQRKWGCLQDGKILSK